MKKSLLFINAILIGLSSFTQNQGFESWTADSVLILDDYESSTSELLGTGINASTRSDDAFSGSYSILLESVLTTDGDTAFGFFLSGDPEDGIPGQQVTIGAIDSIVGYYKCDIQANDSALLICSPINAGVPSGGGNFFFTGTQSTWKRFAFYVNTPTADSLVVAGAIGDPLNGFSGIPGSWIQFDDIQLKGPATSMNIVNSGFENWTSEIWEEPTSWSTSVTRSLGQPTLAVVKSTDSQSGNFALQLNTIPDPDEMGASAGLATNGVFANGETVGGVPYIATPDSLQFYYKYTPAGADTAFVEFVFKNGGTVIDEYVAVLNSATNYTLYSEAINLASSPDSLLITIFAGDSAGSSLLIDDIDFVFPVGINENIKIDKIVSYPNPVNEELNIRFTTSTTNNTSISLIDVTGKTLTTRPLGNLPSGTYTESFNTSSLSSGVYFIEITLENNKTSVNRFVVK